MNGLETKVYAWKFKNRVFETLINDLPSGWVTFEELAAKGLFSPDELFHTLLEMAEDKDIKINRATALDVVEVRLA